MKNQENNKVVIIILSVIIFILLVLVILMGTGVVNFKFSSLATDCEQTGQNNDNNNSNNQHSNQDDNDSNNQDDNNQNISNGNNVVDDVINNDYVANSNELGKFGLGDYNIIKVVYDDNYSFNLLTNGKININFENYISNISNAKDFILFSPPSPDSMLYILTTTGDVYKYEVSNYKTNNYKAVKIDKYSNIKNIITYQTRKANAGGCDYVILVDSNDKYYELDSYCV